MSGRCVIVEKPEEWAGLFPAPVPLISPAAYIRGEAGTDRRGLRVLNLCRSYGYLSIGYYCSLLADARSQRVTPGPRTVLELHRQVLPLLDTSWIDDRAARALKRRAGTQVDLELQFGETDDADLRALGQRIYAEFPCPLLRVIFRRSDRWELHEIRAGYVSKLDAAGRKSLAEKIVSRGWRVTKGATRPTGRYDLAILCDPDEVIPPSNEKALRSFEKEGRDLGLLVERIGKRDLWRLGEFDALFIRETTAIEHHTFRFASKGKALGLVVIDDPDSIMRCANKVYLAELLRTAKIPTPKSLILAKGQEAGVGALLGFPVVLKIPDGSFSRGVLRAENETELRAKSEQLFRQSDLIVAQEYTYTDFDWRIGVLDREPLFACRYFMSRGHWQIVDHSFHGAAREGDSDFVPIAEVPAAVLEPALAAANLIGDGLYGIDLKQVGDQILVIEVNDNANVDVGVEDGELGAGLFRKILENIVLRLEERSSGASRPR